MFADIASRIQKEVEALAPKSMKNTVVAPGAPVFRLDHRLNSLFPRHFPADMGI